MKRLTMAFALCLISAVMFGQETKKEFTSDSQYLKAVLWSSNLGDTWNECCLEFSYNPNESKMGMWSYRNCSTGRGMYYYVYKQYVKHMTDPKTGFGIDEYWFECINNIDKKTTIIFKEMEVGMNQIVVISYDQNACHVYELYKVKKKYE